jgi:hypothetical protein
MNDGGSTRPGEQEMQALFEKYGFIADPACPPRLWAAHRSLVYFILKAFEEGERGAAGLLAAVGEWYRRYDEVASSQPAEQEFPFPDGKVRLRLACKAGCNHCCVTPVSLIGPEVVSIAGYIAENFTGEQRAALAGRIRERERALGGDRNAYHMCPLNVDGLCTVYAVRPFNCRKWHSFDESACRRGFIEGDKTALIPRSAVRSDSQGLVWQSVVAAFSTLGIDASELDLLPALEAALAGTRVADRVAAGEPVFAAARRAP